MLHQQVRMNTESKADNRLICCKVSSSIKRTTLMTIASLHHALLLQQTRDHVSNFGIMLPSQFLFFFHTPEKFC